MPGRNIVKIYNINSYYHVYNRGVDKRTIFIDDQDYAVFMSLFKRYLGPSVCKDCKGRMYIELSKSVELVSFCLMPNHFHLLLYQINLNAVTELIRAVSSSYCTYFNKKYSRTGSLFQGVFRAVSVEGDENLQFVSRYIHRNPINYLDWEWSSLKYWTENKVVDWIKPNRLNCMNKGQYMEYLQDDKAYMMSAKEIIDIVYDND